MYKSAFIFWAILIFLFAFTSASLAQYTGSSGTQEDPYQISTVADWQTLMNTSDDWNKHFIMTADLDLQGVALSPIGDSNNYFTGIFDGNGHIIHNAEVNMPSNDVVGLFGCVRYFELGGQICNLYVENIAITGKNLVGGLVGSIGYRSSLTACYVKGSVRGREMVGGLVGVNYGGLTACYATSLVSGVDFVGGLAGENLDGNIDACYAKGMVIGDTCVGGLVGYNFFGIITGCFWDIENSNQLNSAGGKGLTTKQMKSITIYQNAGWDFVGETDNGTDDTWRMCINGLDYPRLNWEFSQYADFICPDGVGLEDFSYLAQFWMIPEDGDTPADLDKNNVIGITDLMIFCEQWLKGR